MWITSEDLGAYGLDINENLVNLMRKVLEVVPEHIIIRVL